ncbi:MAG: flavin-containing monooxygenase [Solirubrobacteraceae bacterium]
MTPLTTSHALDLVTLRRSLGAANLPTLLLVLAQLSGSDRWLEPPFIPTRALGLDDHDTAGLDAELQDQVRRAALEEIGRVRPADVAPPPPSPERVARLLAASLAEPVPSEYGPLLAEEAGFISRSVEVASAPPAEAFSVLVIGAGMAGLCLAIQLQQAGIAYKVLDKNHDVGGTWLENAYPGCGVDTPSHLYSFSFAPRSDWSHYFAPAEQLRSYFRGLAEDYDLLASIEFGVEVLSAVWDDRTYRWTVSTRHADGCERTHEANVLVTGMGHFNTPHVPPIASVDSFAGPCMHTARWNHDVDIAGKRVAVVGSGASAMQLVPALAGTAAQLVIVQRSRQWAVPHPNSGRPVSPAVRYLLEHVPHYGAWYRLRQLWRFGDRLHSALEIDPSWPNQELSVSAVNDKHRRAVTRYIESELEGRPDLIAGSVPDYPIYGKRPLIDHGWYRALRRPDVELVCGGVAAMRHDAIVTDAGCEYQVDVVALATGFKTLAMLGAMQIVGRSGRTLRDTWGPDDARAYLGMSVPDFPNFFMLFGPNTNAGHGGSAFLHTEFQTRYVMQAIALMIDGGVRSVECRRDVHDDYTAELDAALSRTVWAHPGVTNYYRNSRGRIVGLSPWRYVEYWRRTREIDPSDYVRRG